MRSWMISIATLTLCGAVAAQTQLPGTPNSTSPQNTQQTNGSGNNNGYIVSPPMVSLGDGITPTVITNQDAVQVTVPQNSAVNGAAVQAPSPATLNNGNIVAGAQNGATGSQANGTNGQQRFDFVVAPNGENSGIAGSMSDTSVSLGDAARKIRNGRQIAKRTITNADVEALNAQYPGSNPQPNDQQQQALPTTSNGAAIAAPVARPNGPFGQPVPTPNSGGTAGAAQSVQPAPAYAQPSRSTPTRYAKPSARQGDTGATSTDQNGAGSTTQESTPANNDTNPKQDQQQLPRSSSSLPLLGTLGALSTLAGILYFKMR